MLLGSGAARTEGDDEDTYEADGSAEHIPPVGLEPVEEPPPEQGEDDGHPAYAAHTRPKWRLAWKVGMTP